MDGDTRYSIGDLARRTGLTVKAIRFYADCGLVPPTDRSPTGYRRYDTEAAARLDLVRTLRELGLDLPTIRKVLHQESSLHEVTAAHAEAVAVQIRALRLRHAVLTAATRRGSTPEEMDLMHRLATLSEDERRRLVADFLDTAFNGLDADPAFTGIIRSLTPELPDDPEAEQIDAWVELAELTQDPAFRAAIRQLADLTPTQALRRDPIAAVREQVAPALATDVNPASAQADPFVATVTAHYAQTANHPDDATLRHRLLTHLEAANDPRRERYLHLLAVINGWPAPESLTPTLTWTIQALSTRVPQPNDERGSYCEQR
jgi:DNA-binding transcriptional MerR regulator